MTGVTEGTRRASNRRTRRRARARWRGAIRCPPLAIPIVKQAEKAKNRVAFGESVVEVDRFLRGRLRFVERLLRLHPEEIRELGEAFRQAGIGGRVSGIGLDGPLKIMNRSPLSSVGELAPKIPTLEVQRVSVGAHTVQNAGLSTVGSAGTAAPVGGVRRVGHMTACATAGLGQVPTSRGVDQ
jgi:hypothetical protein